MAEEKKKEVKTNRPVNDTWLTLSGIRKEAKRVRWPKLRSEGGQNGIVENTGEVLVFTGFFAAFFVLCDFVITYLLKIIGIGV
ncbi:MAG: preprotein translocase subunit SecE [Solobacterium sp.]|nr:preprotein translocase subunit SecE [Solobacterium sp.]